MIAEAIRQDVVTGAITAVGAEGSGALAIAAVGANAARARYLVCER